MQTIEILNPDRLRYWCSRIDVPEEAVDELSSVAAKICADPDLSALLNQYYDKTTIQGQWHSEWGSFPIHPEVQALLGSQTSLFYVLAYLAALPSVEQEYLRRGIDLQILHDTFLDIRLWMNHYHEVHGEWGFDQFSWLHNHVSCLLFRLGRLQFKLVSFDSNVIAFRSKSTGEILLLADPTLPLRADGFALRAGLPGSEIPAEIAAQSWLPVFEADESGTKGCPIVPYGYALKQPVYLPHTEWERILQHGDPVLEVHIPAKDRFTTTECSDSLAQAHSFFAKQNPDRPVKAAYCHTWFFTYPLQTILPSDSNIVRFQREFYLFPFPGSPSFLWEFAIGRQYPDLASAPRKTSLQRAVIDWLEQGHEMFDLSGLMFHIPAQWGTQPYMRAWDQHHQSTPR